MERPERDTAPEDVRLVSFDYDRPIATAAPRGRRGGGITLAAVLLVAGAATWSSLRSPPSTPTESIEKLVDAVNAGEVARALSGVHPEATGLAWPGPLDLGDVTLANRTEFSDALGFFGAVGGTIELDECVEGDGGGRLGGEARCRFTATDELSRTIGAGPQAGSLTVEIDSGLIQSLTVFTAEPDGSWRSFETWVGGRTPAEFEQWLADDVRYSVNGVPLSWVPGRVYNTESGTALASLAKGFAAEDLRPPLPLLASGNVE